MAALSLMLSRLTLVPQQKNCLPVPLKALDKVFGTPRDYPIEVSVSVLPRTFSS